jgi:hypothetical protein
MKGQVMPGKYKEQRPEAAQIIVQANRQTGRPRRTCLDERMMLL